MHKILSVFLSLAILFSSCTQVRNIKNAESSESFYSRINKFVKEKTVTVITTDETEYEGKDLTVGHDSTCWVNQDSDERMRCPTDKIYMIRIEDHFKGFVGGVLISIPVVLILGIIGSMLNLHIDTPGNLNQVEALTLILSAGALVGGTIGAISGHRDVFVINHFQE